MSAPAHAQTRPNQRPQQQPQRPDTTEAERLLEEMLSRSWLDDTIQRQARQIDQVTEKFNKELTGVGSKLARAVVVAKAIAVMRQAITEPMVDLFMQLQGQQFGFLVDKTYGREVVKECACHAFLDGLYPFGNEWNIIGGRYMAVLNGWRRKVFEIPGLTECKIDIGEAKPWGQFGLRVECSATYTIEGVTKTLPKNCSLKKDGGFSIDNADGKLHRKMYKAVYLAVCGNSFAGLDAEEVNEAARQANEVAESAPKAAMSDRDAADLRLSDAVVAFQGAGRTKADVRAEHHKKFGTLARRALTAEQLDDFAQHLLSLIAPDDYAEPAPPAEAPAPEPPPVSGQLTPRAMADLRVSDALRHLWETQKYGQRQFGDLLRAQVGAKTRDECDEAELVRVAKALESLILDAPSTAG